MNLNLIRSELSRNATTFKDLLAGLPEATYRWRPEPNNWCLLEIVCHLYDEEREDFRARAQHILEAPDEPLTKIDPETWVKSRKYIAQDYEETLNKFQEERSASIAWLKSLRDPKWDNVYKHPIVDLTPKLLLTNWVAHDYLHIRQILKLKFEYLKQETGENLGYVGEWQAFSKHK